MSDIQATPGTGPVSPVTSSTPTPQASVTQSEKDTYDQRLQEIQRILKENSPSQADCDQLAKDLQDLKSLKDNNQVDTKMKDNLTVIFALVQSVGIDVSKDTTVPPDKIHALSEAKMFPVNGTMMTLTDAIPVITAPDYDSDATKNVGDMLLDLMTWVNGLNDGKNKNFQQLIDNSTDSVNALKMLMDIMNKVTVQDTGTYKNPPDTWDQIPPELQAKILAISPPITTLTSAPKDMSVVNDWIKANPTEWTNIFKKEVGYQPPPPKDWQPDVQRGMDDSGVPTVKDLNDPIDWTSVPKQIRIQIADKIGIGEEDSGNDAVDPDLAWKLSQYARDEPDVYNSICNNYYTNNYGASPDSITDWTKLPPDLQNQLQTAMDGDKLASDAPDWIKQNPDQYATVWKNAVDAYNNSWMGKQFGDFKTPSPLPTDLNSIPPFVQDQLKTAMGFTSAIEMTSSVNMDGVKSWIANNTSTYDDWSNDYFSKEIGVNVNNIASDPSTAINLFAARDQLTIELAKLKAGNADTSPGSMYDTIQKELTDLNNRFPPDTTYPNTPPIYPPSPLCTQNPPTDLSGDQLQQALNAYWSDPPDPALKALLTSTDTISKIKQFIQDENVTNSPLANSLDQANQASQTLSGKVSNDMQAWSLTNTQFINLINQTEDDWSKMLQFIGQKMGS